MRCFTGNVTINVAPSPSALFAEIVPAVAVGNFTANGQADAGSLVLAAGMEALENLENPVEILFVKPDPVVPDHDLADFLARASSRGGIRRYRRTFAEMIDLGLDAGAWNLMALEIRF